MSADSCNVDCWLYTCMELPCHCEFHGPFQVVLMGSSLICVHVRLVLYTKA